MPIDTKKYYYIGPWILNSAQECWEAPANTIGSFDLRPRVDKNIGFFATSIPIISADYTLLNADGEDFRTYHTTLAQREAWRSLLTILKADIPDSVTLLRDIVIKTFEECGDPEAGERFYPPTATHDGYLEFVLGGHSQISRRKFQGENDPAWPVIQAHLMNQYKIIDTQAALTKSDVNQKILSVWQDKYSITDYKKFIPIGTRIVKPKLPTTTITDDFNRSDADALGSSSEGWSWTECVADMDIVSNQAKTMTNDSDHHARAESSLSSDDHYASMDCISLGAGADSSHDIICRYDAADNGVNAAKYLAFAYIRDDKVYLRAYTGSGKSTLGSASITRTYPKSLKVQADGSTIKVFWDGTEEISVTNTTVSGNLRCGIGGYDMDGVVDNFSAADILTGSATVTGTAITGGVTESEIVTGGETIIITLTGDTWVATVGADNAITDALIAGITSAQSETNGWNNVVRANMVFGDVARTSDTIVTITLAAEATYSITANETITITIPATALTAAGEVVATPTFDVTNEGAFLAAWANSSNVLLQPGVAA